MLTAHSAVAARALPAQRCISGVMLLQALRRQPSPADARAGITGVLLLHLPPPPPPVLLTVSISSSSCTPPPPLCAVSPSSDASLQLNFPSRAAVRAGSRVPLLLLEFSGECLMAVSGAQGQRPRISPSDGGGG